MTYLLQKFGLTLLLPQEKLSRKIEESLAEIEGFISHIEALHSQKQAVIAWSKEETGTPVLKAAGAIFTKTKIHGQHAVIHIPETVRNVTVQEEKPPGPDAVYQMSLVNDG